MKIYLLTHQREAERPTNTGQLAVNLFPQQITRVIWSRLTADKNLQQLALTKQVALIHPSGRPLPPNAIDSSEDQPVQQFILLDGTWQEAQKILNRTSYLKQLDVFSLTPQAPSKYQLRRNQKTGGLCTAECVIELFKTQGEIDKAENLLEHFELFNRTSG